MLIEEIRDLEVRYENGIERFFQTFDFVSARPAAKQGTVEIAFRRRVFYFFPLREVRYCGSNITWRNALGERPTPAEGVFLCQVWLALSKKPMKRKLFENPLRN